MPTKIDMPPKIEFVDHEGDDDGDDDGGDYGDDDMMMALGQGGAISPKGWAKGKKKFSSPVVLSPGPPIRTRAGGPLTSYFTSRLF